MVKMFHEQPNQPQPYSPESYQLLLHLLDIVRYLLFLTLQVLYLYNAIYVCNVVVGIWYKIQLPQQRIITQTLTGMMSMKTEFPRTVMISHGVTGADITKSDSG